MGVRIEFRGGVRMGGRNAVGLVDFLVVREGVLEVTLGGGNNQSAPPSFRFFFVVASMLGFSEILGVAFKSSSSSSIIIVVTGVNSLNQRRLRFPPIKYSQPTSSLVPFSVTSIFQLDANVK